MYKKTILDNGLRVITYAMPNMQSVALGVWVKVGSRYELFENRGIAHYLEHLLFKGTEKYSCRQIKESIEGVGGSLNGFTSEELTCYLTKLPSRHMNLGIDILSEMVINPLLLEDDISREKSVVLEEIKMYRDLPQSYVHELLDQLLWPQHPLGYSILGTAESVSSLARKDFCAFKEQYYIPSNIVVSAAGLLEHEEFSRKVEGIFCRPNNPKGVNSCSAVKENQQKPELKILDKDTEQTHLALGFRSFKREHRLKHALGLLHIILGGNMSSRLFNELREKRGLAYDIGTHVKRFQDTGVFLVHAGIDNNKVNKTIELVLRELVKIKEKLVTADEFKRAKEFYLGQLMLSLEDTLDHMLWIGESTISLDKTNSLQEIIKEVEGVSKEEIREAAGHIFRNQHISLALIGPLGDSRAKIYNQLQLD